MSTHPPSRSRRILIALTLAIAVTLWVSLRGDSGHPSPGTQTAAPTAVNSAEFAKGACMSYPPLEGNRHLTVFLDAGHGGIDPGSVGRTQSGRTIYEADLTLPVELDTMALLRRKGFRVVVSRTGNTSVWKLGRDDLDGDLLSAQGVHDDVAARAICANEAHANVLVGIYFDAGTPQNAGSVTGYDAVRPFAAQNLRLATLVQRDVLGAMNRQGWGIPSEGVQTDDELGSSLNAVAVNYGHLLLLGPAERGYFSTPSEMPGALIEPLFITDPFEGTIAASTRGQHVMASGLAQAIEQYFAPVRSRGSRARSRG
ncbi:MAG TPA: N-acetylmuramoyl-L-alanine amidase [Solirubrobacteraceae bacterium]|nr:N-acetylmuramoyl-L-alanine amidase [Solirubrobacteraceae bacterium]